MTTMDSATSLAVQLASYESIVLDVKVEVRENWSSSHRKITAAAAAVSYSMENGDRLLPVCGMSFFSLGQDILQGYPIPQGDFDLPSGMATRAH